ncbi:MAG: hypothetical protein RJB38_2016 [Pseudomonadota bacterium]|jgi:PmbA protein
MHSHIKGHPALIQAAEHLARLPAQKFEIYFQRKVSTKIDARDQKIDTLSRADDSGLSFRVLRDHRLGFSYTTSLEPSAVERAIDSAWEIAGLMPEDPHHDLSSFSETPYPAWDRYDEAGLSLPLDAKIRRALELEAACRGANDQIEGIRSASISETRYEVSLIDSSGEQLWHEASIYSASILCRAGRNGESQMGYDSRYATHWDELDAQATGVRAAQRAVEKLGAISAPTRTCPAIFRNEAMIQLVSFLSGSFSCENIDKNRSLLSGMLGKKIFSERVQLVDDGLWNGGLASAPFDGEGTPSGSTALVSGGSINSFLYDGYHARKHHQKPTGNAVRSIKAKPSIGTTNLVLQPGKKSFEELCGLAGSGVVITDLMGVHTANPITGEFSLGASGFLLEKGRITAPIRGFAVAGNVLHLFRDIVELAHDLEFQGSVGAPSAMVNSLSIGGN